MGKRPESKLKKLERFYEEIAKMTLSHDVIDDSACVTANRLGAALEKVDPEWYNINRK